MSVCLYNMVYQSVPAFCLGSETLNLCCVRCIFLEYKSTCIRRSVLDCCGIRVEHQFDGILRSVSYIDEDNRGRD
jgi:hypothetical protein